jgi:hypothetical protein
MAPRAGRGTAVRTAVLAVVFALTVLAGNLSAARAQGSIIGTWEGLYECPQGVTGLTLTISGTSPSNLSGNFRFYPTPDNARAGNGSYEVSVTFDLASNRFEARGTRWIEQPEGYMFANLRGVLQGRQLIGTVENEGCGAFELNRTGQ